MAIVGVKIALNQNAQGWEAILDALDSVTPLVEDGGGGWAYCEMRGITGRPQAWMRRIRDALAGLDCGVTLGVGSNRFVARAAVYRGDGSVCAPGDEAGFVAPIPLDVLEIDPRICDRFHLLGIRNLGELAALPHGPFVRRFGPEAARWHLFARGIDPTPFVPRPHRVKIERTLFGEGSAASEEALLFALRGLVARIADDLVLLGKRAAELLLALECENGESREIRVRVAHPTAREAMLFDLLRARLEGVELSAAVEGLRLGVERMESGGVPLMLFSGDDPDAEAVELAIARLDAAFGEGTALRAQVIEGYRPESQVTYERFEVAALQSKGWSAAKPAAALEAATPQLRLFEPREIDVVTRDGILRFAGTPPQAIVDFAGPWRAQERWWSDRSLVRDDYDVMFDDGAIYRITHRDRRWFVLGVYD